MPVEGRFNALGELCDSDWSRVSCVTPTGSHCVTPTGSHCVTPTESIPNAYNGYLHIPDLQRWSFVLAT